MSLPAPHPPGPARRAVPVPRIRSRISYSRRSVEVTPVSAQPPPRAPRAHSQPRVEPAPSAPQRRRRNREMDETAVAALESAGYAVVSELSDGSFGAVYRATRLRDGLHVAAKAVRRERLNAGEEAAVRSQAATLAGLRHRHLAALVDAFEHPKYIFHVFEFLHGGDLFDRLEARGRPFTEPQALELAAQILRAVGYLHSRRAAHRDIKLENFVFETVPTARAPVLKLIDFDLLLVRGRDAPQGATCTDMCGTVLYVPPELAAAREYVPEEADMWAVGVVLYVLLCFEMPFQGRLPRDILREVRNASPSFAGPMWKLVSRRTRELVENLLSKSGAARPAAEEALSRVEMIATGPVPVPRHVTLSLRNMSARMMVRGKRRTRRSRVRNEVDLANHPFLTQDRASQDELDTLVCYDHPRLQPSYTQEGRAMYARSGDGAERMEYQRKMQSENDNSSPSKGRVSRLLGSIGPDGFARHMSPKRRTNESPRRRSAGAKMKRFSRHPSERPMETGYC